MNKAFGRQLAYARFAGPLIVAAIFFFCSTFGLVLGIIANVSHPAIHALPVYPRVLSVSALSPGRVGSLSTPTMTPIAMPTLLTNFVFDTSDTRTQVLDFYRDVMENEYGMSVQGGDARDPNMNSTAGVTVLRYGRAAQYKNWTVGDTVVPSVWVMERVTITVDGRAPGVTHATVYFDILPLTR